MGYDRVLYSVDYPYESTTEASQWFEAVDLEEQTKKAGIALVLESEGSHSWEVILPALLPCLFSAIHFGVE